MDGQLDGSRLHVTGLLTYSELVELFRCIDLHFYITRLYEVSWGLTQAAAWGANRLVNRFGSMAGDLEWLKGSAMPLNTKY